VQLESTRCEIQSRMKYLDLGTRDFSMRIKFYKALPIFHSEEKDFPVRNPFLIL